MFPQIAPARDRPHPRSQLHRLTPAAAMPLLPVVERLVAAADSPRACPAGTHEGYLGKYCWHDGERERTACPTGT